MPSLVLWKGPLKGRLFFLHSGANLFLEQDGVFIHGRDPDLSLPNLRVDLEPKGCFVQASEPETVWVNEASVSGKTLIRNKDLILWEGHGFRFYEDDEDWWELEDGRILFSETDRFVVCERSLSGDPAIPPEGKDLQALLHTLFSVRSPSEWAERISAFLKSKFPFMEAHLFLWNEQGVFEKQPLPGDKPSPLQLSKTLLKMVLKERKAIVSQDIVKDPRFQGSQSLLNQSVRSLVVVPLILGQKILGLLYGQTSVSQGEFRKEDLDILLPLSQAAGVALENLKSQTTLRDENLWLTQRFYESNPFIGKSPEILKILENIKKVADTPLTVLIRGETGTGKEKIAERIHENSSRKKSPFVTVHCAALSETLLESELFGHEKGSFTDAKTTRMGKLEQPQGGTLFLDEVGDIPLPVQVKLLRFLQTKELERVGGREKIKVDARIVAATNRDLEKMMKEGQFREDFYFRLKGFQITLPPLRERPGDIQELAQFFLFHFCKEHGIKAPSFTEDAKRSLLQHSWPGNVRELKQKIEQAIVLCDGKNLLPEDLGLGDEGETSSGIAPSDYRRSFTEFEKQYLSELLTLHQGNVSKAARESGLERSHFHSKLRKYDIDPATFRKSRA